VSNHVLSDYDFSLVQRHGVADDGRAGVVVTERARPGSGRTMPPYGFQPMTWEYFYLSLLFFYVPCTCGRALILVWIKLTIGKSLYCEHLNEI
jgi:anaerobic selenocysteine-containing dehydrogenase